jgi:hypothetical protein
MTAPLTNTRERQPAAFRQVDVTRAVRGATAAGLHVSSIKIGPDGGIEILTGGAPRVEVDVFSDWKAKRDARSSQRN